MKKGLVLKSTGKWYDVKAEDGGLFTCQIIGKLRLKGVQTTNPVAAGDHVLFEVENGERGNIVEIIPRKNYIIRRSVNLSKEAQIVAANLDQVLLMVTISRPQTTPGFIDRFLVTAEAYHIPVVLVFHKVDQYDEVEHALLDKWIKIYSAIGYPCLQTSLVSKAGLDELEEQIKNKVSLISGHSGTGKSSLINYFIPEKNLRTGEISDASRKGQHTTTFAEMHALSFGGYLVDTPGIKGFGLVDIGKDELHHYFPEFFQVLPNCKFKNCHHLNEPDCAVRAAMEKGVIAVSRYNSYVSMMQDQEERSPYR